MSLFGRVRQMVGATLEKYGRGAGFGSIEDRTRRKLPLLGLLSAALVGLTTVAALRWHLIWSLAVTGVLWAGVWWLNARAVRTIANTDPGNPRIPMSRKLVGVLLAGLVGLAVLLLAFESQVRPGDEPGPGGQAVGAPSARTEALRAERDRLAARSTEIADGRDPTAMAIDRDLVGSQAALDAVQRGLPCEADGKCGSEEKGRGPIYEAKLAETRRLTDRVTSLIEQTRVRDNELKQERARIDGRLGEIEREGDRTDGDKRSPAVSESMDVGRRLEVVLDAGGGAIGAGIGILLFVVAVSGLYFGADVGLLCLAIRRCTGDFREMES